MALVLAVLAVLVVLVVLAVAPAVEQVVMVAERVVQVVMAPHHTACRTEPRLHGRRCAHACQSYGWPLLPFLQARQTHDEQANQRALASMGLQYCRMF
jgi:hypothetical protein